MLQLVSENGKLH